MDMAGGGVAVKDDLTWAEVFDLGQKYLKIPVALLLVEAFYWFLTQPVNTLAPIQISEAWLWHNLSEIIWGSGTSELLYHNGFLTKLEFTDAVFPGQFSVLSLYVSDECAGIHEMIFISTLILLTDGVPQRLRIKSALVMCGIVYVLNIVRLLTLYPLAINACTGNPNDPSCLTDMWTFHTAVYQWAFLVVLLLMWLGWFKWVNAGKAIQRAAEAEKQSWSFAIRKEWSRIHLALIFISAILIAGAAANIMLDPVAIDAKADVDACDYYQLITADCGNSQQAWDNAISESWSLASIGLVTIAATTMTIKHPPKSEEE
ncbi:MAG TPA: exosortase/archaeosortase family protein [Candidatus Poseidoniales archaeon]|jgi:exosortase/archaeosortase family protein|nr:MAG: hypothetical protein CXT71_05785 [Euryarchaeota archaeon]HIF46154.1 exosortase/archaeosortase family protein [Candidatus Poseidoniales archaeon]HIL64984.1 exosortase/archaeosortase family protein [Candidatus Poseidoniales archaeon]